MFFKKSKHIKRKNDQKTEWLRGVVMAEKLIDENYSVQEIHCRIGSNEESFLCDPRGLRITYWKIPDTKFAEGVIDFLIHKGIKTHTG